MANSWIEHVKAYAKKHKISYREAMSKAKASYKKGGKAKGKGKQTKKDKMKESKAMKGKTKGKKSKSHKGDKDFTTKKGDKVYHEGGKDVKKKKKPYK